MFNMHEGTMSAGHLVTLHEVIVYEGHMVIVHKRTLSRIHMVTTECHFLKTTTQEYCLKIIYSLYRRRHCVGVT